MSTTHETTKTWHRDIEAGVTEIFPALLDPMGDTVQFAVLSDRDTCSSDGPTALSRRAEWRDAEYRQAYMEAAIEQGVAWQIRINRKFRGITQKQLANQIGTTQSGVSRLEDPEYGAHSLETLVSIAHAFDCALSVKFVPYSQLAIESERLSETDQYAAPYTLEVEGWS